MIKRTYEGMFLLDPTQAAQEWDKLKTQVTGMLERRGGVILSAKKWGEKKLAYEIKGHKRGTYFLVYFEMPVENVNIVRRDFQLSEIILRDLIIAHKKPFKIPEVPEISEEETTQASTSTHQNEGQILAGILGPAPQEKPKEQNQKTN